MLPKSCYGLEWRPERSYSNDSGMGSTVAYHRWMGDFALMAPVYVQTMGLVTVCFHIVIKALVLGVLEGLCEFAVMYSNHRSISMIPLVL